MTTSSIDYRKYYDDEEYLLDVGQNFRKHGTLDAPDLYMLLMWKANRAKNYHRERLKRKAGSFEAAASGIASDLTASSEPKQRLQVLMINWDFALPTATAILALLHPEEFTVYDWRVCDEIEFAYKPWVCFSDKLWDEYCRFKEGVVAATPGHLTLREKDRFLIGRSIRSELERDCRD